MTDNLSTSVFGTSYNWTVATTLQLGYGFNFVLYNDTLGAIFLNHFATVPFNITQNATTSQNSSLPTSTISSSGDTAIMSPTEVALSTITLTSSPSTSPTTSTAGATSTAGLPYRIAIGLGVGLGVAVPLCLLVGLFVGLKLRRKAQPKLPENVLGFHGQLISKPLPSEPLQELYASDIPELHQEHAKELHESFVAESSPTYGLSNPLSEAKTEYRSMRRFS